MSTVLRQEGVLANATFAAAAVSNSIPISVERPRGLTLFVPSGWSAADILVETSLNGTNWYSTAITQLTNILTSTAKQYPVDAAIYMIGAANFLRLRSVAVGGSTNVNQTITIIVGFLN